MNMARAQEGVMIVGELDGGDVLYEAKPGMTQAELNRDVERLSVAVNLVCAPRPSPLSFIGA